MKRKLSLILIIALCLGSLLALTSCEAVLDLIFGKIEPDNADPKPNEHVHKMVEQTYVGETCSAQKQIKYYKCSDCNKCYLDEQGNDEIVDISALGGHVFVIKRDDEDHYYECGLCHVEQENSRVKHSSDRWQYNPTEHYKLCDECGYKFASSAHDETGSCSVCGRQADYKSICNSRYGYNHLSTFEHGSDMQKLYDNIDKAVKSAHDNSDLNGSLTVEVGLDLFLNVGEAKITVSAYSHDNPLYYWLDRSTDFQYPKDEANRPENERRSRGVIFSVLDEYCSADKRAEQNAKLYSAIDGYLSAVSNENDPYLISLGLHDAVIANVDYAFKSDGTAEDASWAHNIVGVFDNKNAVCEGYAKAYQLLLNACGTANIYVTGSSRGVGHAWNLVNLARDGEQDRWYWYDVTWDDQPNMAGGVIYDYFCKTDVAFANDHDVTVPNTGDGVNYLYPLPDTASEDYDTVGLELDETFNKQCLSFKLVGYNRLSVDKCLYAPEDGVVAIPANVEYNGRTYDVVQIDNEAFATDSGTHITSPTVVKIVIPETVVIINNKSFKDCDTLKTVEFADPDNWSRYAPVGEKPVYKPLSVADLSDGAKACALLKERYKADLFSSTYPYIWVKSN